jgi:TfoX/Sxy family transcriptional regulator of competence genes
VSLDADLMSLLLDAVERLPGVAKKRMFGFEALWADGRIFALTWRGRISLRLPDPAAAAELLALPGARALTIGEGRISPAGQRWIDVPEAFHDDPHELRRWAQRAYDLARGGAGFAGDGRSPKGAALKELLPKPRKRRVRRA